MVIAIIVLVLAQGLAVLDSSLDRSLAFYELLGFRKVVGPVGPEPVAILTHTSGVEVNLILNTAEGNTTNPLMDVPEKLPGYTHMALLCADIDAAEQRLAAAHPASERMDLPFGIRALFVRDPDRNVIELDQLPEGFTLQEAHARLARGELGSLG